jgi:hypothetical protein
VKRAIQVGVFVALALVAGCKGPPPTRAKFNNNMSLANKDLLKAARAFRKALDPLKEGKEFKPGDLDSAISKCESLVKKLKDDYEDATLPNNSATAPQLLEDYQKFLAAEEKIIDKMKEIAKVAKSPGGGANWPRIQQLLGELDREESGPLSAVKATQKKYSDEHNFKLSDSLTN